MYDTYSHSEKGLAGCDDSSGNKNKSDTLKNFTPNQMTFSPLQVFPSGIFVAAAGFKTSGSFPFSLELQLPTKMEKMYFYPFFKSIMERESRYEWCQTALIFQEVSCTGADETAQLKRTL